MFNPAGVPALGFASKTTPVPAVWFNWFSNNISDALDAIGGGTYQNVGSIVLKSSAAGFKLNYPGIGFPIELRGFVTIGQTNIVGMPVGVGALTVEIPATFSVPASFPGGITGATTFDGATFQGSVTFEQPATFELGATSDQDITLTGTARVVFDAPRAFPRPFRGALAPDLSKWTPDVLASGSWPGRAQQTAATNPANVTECLIFEADIRDDCTLVSAEVYVDPAAGHGAIPANVPQLHVMIYDCTTGAVVGGPWIAAHNPVLVPTYEARTLLSPTIPPGTTVDATSQKVIAYVFGEGGAGFVAGLNVDTPRLTISTAAPALP